MSSINYNDICSKLKCYGIEVNDADVGVIELISEGVEKYIINFCNISFMPAELYYVAVDMCCGTYIKNKMSAGQIESISQGVVSSIKEGDVSVDFRQGSSQAEILKEIANKLTERKGELECFRKLKW